MAAPDATDVLVVDPIDGTRPAMAGLESACVAVALAPLGDGEPTMADVEIGCVVEIKSGDWYLAVRGRGVESTRAVSLSPNAEIGRMFWAYGFRGRPVRPTVEVLGDLIDASSVGGGTFELGSQAFAMTRIVTGQLDAVIEVGSRLIDDVPGMREEFERVGRGEVLNNSPYDLAAPWLCLREAGGIVTDGWGEPLDHHRLLGSGHEFQMSSISASNRTLHTQARARRRRGSRAAAGTAVLTTPRGIVRAPSFAFPGRDPPPPAPSAHPGCSSPSPSPTRVSPTTRASSAARWSTRSASSPSR